MGKLKDIKDELELIIHNFKSAYILIDDFKVPGLDCFKYGSYKDQECSMEYIKDSLNTNNKYAIQYPTYTERTSKQHPLVGWILIKY